MSSQNGKKRTTITSADTKSLGYEYQYLYFFLQLFSLRVGDEVGYEALDDVHKVETKKELTYFYQLKHTVKRDSSGKSANLTELSVDLWKTLSNWAKLVRDPAENRAKQSSQREFLDKSRFVFVSNRDSGTNNFIKKITMLKEKKIKMDEIKSYLSNLEKTTSSEKIKLYIGDVLMFDGKMLERFLLHVDFIDLFDDILERIREEIRNKFIPEDYVEDVFDKLYSKLKKDFFKKCNNRQHQIINYDEWIKAYGPIFQAPRHTMLPLREYKPLLPDDLMNQNFVKELIEIDAVDDNDKSQIEEYTSNYLKIEMQMTDWEEEGRISNYDIEHFEASVRKYWINLHKRSHRSTKNNNDDNRNALECFDLIMLERLKMLERELGIELSNGEFIKLANEEKIGWKYKWKKVYF